MNHVIKSRELTNIAAVILNNKIHFNRVLWGFAPYNLDIENLLMLLIFKLVKKIHVVGTTW